MSQPTNADQADSAVSYAPQTRAILAGLGADAAHRAVIPPLYLSANYVYADPAEKPAFDYSRTRNPTRAILADAIADLEGAAGAVVLSSGMAAVDLVLHLFKADDLVVAPHDCYGGTRRLLNARAARGDLYVAFVDFCDPAALTSALARGPGLVLVETPSNPLLRITDLEEVSRRAHAAGALVAVDNTFLSPALQRPIEHGADLVIHSTTKYLNGHSDVVGGAVAAKDPAHVERLSWWANCIGSTGAPFDSWLTLRGLRTLHLRVRAQEENAARAAEALERLPEVARVYYPGLASHPGRDVARRQQAGFGSILSFELRGGLAAAQGALRRLQLFSVAASVGGVESLACLPATMTHAGISERERTEAGIGPGLVRLSFGIEDGEDLIADLVAAIEAAAFADAA